MRRALISVVLIVAALTTAGPVAATGHGEAAPTAERAAEVASAGAIDACVTFSRTTSLCYRNEPLRLQFGKKFVFRGRLSTGLAGPVSVWRKRPDSTRWVQVGSAPVNAEHRFIWQWRPTQAQVADGYYRFQFRVGDTRSNNLRVKVLLGLCDGDVCLQGYVYVPDQLTIAVGDTITWTSISGINHTVDADDESFESDLMDYGDSFEHTFLTPGVFTYHCDIHRLQTGTITVE